MSVVNYLPGSISPFTLQQYRDDLLKPYYKLYFWLCEKEEYENTAPDDQSCTDLESIKNAVNNIRAVLGNISVTNRVAVRRSTCFQAARQKKWFKAKAQLKVIFIGESAIDDGGPCREFLSEQNQQALDLRKKIGDRIFELERDEMRSRRTDKSMTSSRATDKNIQRMKALLARKEVDLKYARLQAEFELEFQRKKFEFEDLKRMRNYEIAKAEAEMLEEREDKYSLCLEEELELETQSQEDRVRNYVSSLPHADLPITGSQHNNVNLDKDHERDIGNAQTANQEPHTGNPSDNPYNPNHVQVNNVNTCATGNPRDNVLNTGNPRDNALNTGNPRDNALNTGNPASQVYQHFVPSVSYATSPLAQRAASTSNGPVQEHRTSISPLPAQFSQPVAEASMLQTSPNSRVPIAQAYIETPQTGSPGQPKVFSTPYPDVKCPLLSSVLHATLPVISSGYRSGDRRRHGSSKIANSHT
ncbi:hypothetical protein QZH41_007778 [Actinostola sp. cb2023]|nr:hypothetical protein QZH41_007778 [Actinostola sp. cb2023]